MTARGTGPSPPANAATVLRGLQAVGATLATAESLTGGLVAAALTEVPGSSASFRGGVVAYATDLKARLLGVPEDLLARCGPVHPDVARAMATGVAERLGATYGLATTGVAGPEGQEGHAAGEVYVAVAGPGGAQVRDLQVPGGRADVRRATVQAALALLADALAGPMPGTRERPQ